jgi:hypothetical protein
MIPGGFRRVAEEGSMSTADVSELDIDKLNAFTAPFVGDLGAAHRREAWAVVRLDSAGQIDPSVHKP